MRSNQRRGGSLAIMAVVGLSLAGVPGVGAAAAPEAMFIAVCGDPAHLIPIPIKRDDGQKRHCPMGCHAACARRAFTDEEE
ncbi:MAG: hypothetical protein K2W86_03510 [Sphingomonas sp.]|uniref:hypothetical protein n=1 Tax=Sphingomonas sp. TaxID=28214 RepID=UPI0035A8AF15|nr:hypothetical protein [Sphingomonas sp.]